MGRPIVVDSDNPRWPLWLSQGKKVACLMEKYDGIGKKTTTGIPERIQTETGLTLRTAHRFEVLYRFLLREYPEMLRRRKLRAGSAAILELMKLHEHSSETAKSVATKVLSGEITHSQIRAFREGSVAPTLDIARKFATARRIADFEREALELVRKHPDLIGIENFGRVELPISRKPLYPDLLFKQGDCTIAVEFKAAGPRRDNYIAGSYLARLAQLLQRYDCAVLVLPDGCEDLAKATVELQRTWGPANISVVCLTASGPKKFSVRNPGYRNAANL